MTGKHQAMLSTRKNGFVGRQDNAGRSSAQVASEIYSKGRSYFQDED